MKTARPLLALLTAGMCALAACSRNPAETLLTRSGTPPVLPGNGALTGQLDFGDGTHPATLVLVARVRPGIPTSEFSTIQVVGTPSGFNIGASPALTQLAPGAWIDTLSLPAGALEWKFVTNGAFDNPPDYGKAGSQEDGLENDADKGAPGPDGNLVATVPGALAGTLLCTLEEQTDNTAHYRFAKVASGLPAVFSSTSDGTFHVTSLAAGTYNVLIRAAHHPPQTIANVVVGSGTTNIGTISFGSGGNTGGISGTVSFDDASYPDLATPPYPIATVDLYQGTFKLATAVTNAGDRGFGFGGLAAGSYTLHVTSHLFSAADAGPVTVATDNVDVGTVNLTLDPNRVSSQINLLGNFNGFPGAPFPDSTQMEQTALGVWTYPATGFAAQQIPAGIQNFKFVTDGAYDNPTDWGGDESVTLTVPLTNQPTSLVSGTGTAIHANFPATGAYVFTLDERRGTFSVQPAATARRLSLRRSAR